MRLENQGCRSRATGRSPPQMLPAQLLRPSRSRRKTGSAWLQFGPNQSHKLPGPRRSLLRALLMLNNFPPKCRSEHSPFDLLVKHNNSLFFWQRAGKKAMTAQDQLKAWPQREGEQSVMNFKIMGRQRFEKPKAVAFLDFSMSHS